jgi:hypothetical protein
LRLLDGFLVLGAGSEASLRRRISRSIHLVIGMKMVDGQPCLNEVTEVVSAGSQGFELKPLVRFAGVQNGKRRWEILENSSRCIEMLKTRGCELSVGPALSLAQR